MKIADSTVLVTGANRGLGKALVEEALRRDAKRVYAGARQSFAHPDKRVTPLILDVTNGAQIQRAVENVESLDILINNAGVDLHDDLSDRAGLDRHLAVNIFGTHGVTRAFLPLVARSRGAIVNVLSVAALASVPFTPAYSIKEDVPAGATSVPVPASLSFSQAATFVSSFVVSVSCSGRAKSQCARTIIRGRCSSR